MAKKTTAAEGPLTMAATDGKGAPEASKSEPAAETKKAPAAAKGTKTQKYFIGNAANNNMARRRSGLTFFPTPHVYLGEPTPEMREDPYISITEVGEGTAREIDARYRNVPSYESGMDRERRLQASEYWGVDAEDLRKECMEREIDPSKLDYRGMIESLDRAGTAA